MKQQNVEIKAKCNHQDKIRSILKSHHAVFKGTDHQIDTYFKVGHGRLKLREGNIENALVYYERENKKGPKQSKYILYETPPASPIKNILTESLGILTIVDKIREIYFIDNIKFHLDKIKDLGTFVEIEAKELSQCNKYLDLFEISKDDLIATSYSDLLEYTNVKI